MRIQRAGIPVRDGPGGPGGTKQWQVTDERLTYQSNSTHSMLGPLVIGSIPCTLRTTVPAYRATVTLKPIPNPLDYGYVEGLPLGR
jgi:hypothetical protein